MTKKIYIVGTSDGENQFVFDEKLKLIDGWFSNDANYRHEYMNGFMEKLGITVERRLPADANAEDMFAKASKKLWGI